MMLKKGKTVDITYSNVIVFWCDFKE